MNEDEIPAEKITRSELVKALVPHVKELDKQTISNVSINIKAVIAKNMTKPKDRLSEK